MSTLQSSKELHRQIESLTCKLQSIVMILKPQADNISVLVSILKCKKASMLLNTESESVDSLFEILYSNISLSRKADRMNWRLNQIGMFDVEQLIIFFFIALLLERCGPWYLLSGCNW